MNDFTLTSEACLHTWSDELLRIPSTHQIVHRDECAYCCHQCHQEDGIYVCMTCFCGVCRTHIEKHRQLRPDHCLYCRIKELPAAAPDVEETKDVQSLGVIPHIEFESDIVCTACCTRFATGETVGNVFPGCSQESFNAIVNAPVPGSSPSDIPGGFQRLQCSHLLMLQQISNPLPVSDNALLSDGHFRCSEPDCNCTENCWLCLTCGYVGCSREETGGNGHAKQHNASTSHNCTVKLGTITPHGADVYCYACDDMVNDENIATHLKFFGIDTSVAKKTAKTMGELEYDYSTSFDFNQITEAGTVLQIVYGAGKTGIMNIGNSCYISSVLQCLTRLPSFQRSFYPLRKSPHLLNCKADPYTCHHCQMERMVEGLCSGKYGIPGTRRARKVVEGSNTADGDICGVCPRLFKNVFAGNHPDFSTGFQQDAHEYLLYLLDQLQEHVVLPSELLDQVPGSDELIHPSNQFGFRFRNRGECIRCHRVRYRREEDVCLSIVPPISAQTLASTLFSAEPSSDSIDRPTFDLTACLNATLGVENVECRCEFCGQPSTYQNTIQLETFPNVLALLIRRDYFDPVTLGTKKIDAFVPIPEEIDLHSYRADALSPDIVVEEAPSCFMKGREPIKQRSKVESSKSPEVEINDESLAVVMSMGFTSKHAVFALKKNGGNVEQAVNYLLCENVDEALSRLENEESAPCGSVGSVQENSKVFTDGNEKYNLVGMISHIGASAKTGHYVCHIRDPETNDWLLFNDEKVGKSLNPPFSLGSLYFFSRS